VRDNAMLALYRRARHGVVLVYTVRRAARRHGAAAAAAAADAAV